MSDLEHCIALDAVIGLGELIHEFNLEGKISDDEMERCEDLITMLEIYLRRNY